MCKEKKITNETKDTNTEETNDMEIVRRSCTVLESLEESLKEMQYNRKNNIKGKTWRELRAELKNEEKEK